MEITRCLVSSLSPRFTFLFTTAILFRRSRIHVQFLIPHWRPRRFLWLTPPPLGVPLRALRESLPPLSLSATQHLFSSLFPLHSFLSARSAAGANGAFRGSFLPSPVPSIQNPASSIQHPETSTQHPLPQENCQPAAFVHPLLHLLQLLPYPQESESNPAMEAGLTDQLWNVEKILDLIG